MRRKFGVGSVVVALFVTGVSSGMGSARLLSSDAGVVAFTATLASRHEVPKPIGATPGAGGRFSAGLTRTASSGTLVWRLTFHGLTGKAIAAHVHIGKVGKAGPVAAPLCGPCRSGQRGSATINGRTVSALLNGSAYVNVHTSKNPAGEIRGQVRKGGTPIVPPTTTTSTTSTTTTTTTTTPYPPYP